MDGTTATLVAATIVSGLLLLLGLLIMSRLPARTRLTRDSIISRELEALLEQFDSRTRPRAPDAENRRREYFLSRQHRILRYLNREALADLATSTRPHPVGQQVSQSRTATTRKGIFARVRFLGAKAEKQDETSSRTIVEQQRTESFEYQQLEHRLVSERSVRLLLEDFEPEEILQSLREVESELERLKKRGVSLPEDVAETYREERLAGVAEDHLQAMRATPFLLLMEGSFGVEREDGRVTLTYRHPVSPHLPGLEVAFRVTCEPTYTRQEAGFLAAQVNVTVLGQAIGVQDSPSEFILHILPVAIY